MVLEKNQRDSYFKKSHLQNETYRSNGVIWGFDGMFHSVRMSFVENLESFVVQLCETPTFYFQFYQPSFLPPNTLL